MINLLNNLTLTFVWLIHNFELEFVDLKFRVLPTIGTTVETGLNDWIEFSFSFRKGSVGYAAVIGKSKDDVWTLILGEWTKYITYISTLSTYSSEHAQWIIDHAQWVIDVQSSPELTEPIEPEYPAITYVDELGTLFEYVNNVGVKV